MKADKNFGLSQTGRIMQPKDNNTTQAKMVASLADVVRIAIYEDCYLHKKDLPDPNFVTDLVNHLLEMIYDNYKFG